MSGLQQSTTFHTFYTWQIFQLKQLLKACSVPVGCSKQDSEVLVCVFAEHDEHLHRIPRQMKITLQFWWHRAAYASWQGSTATSALSRNMSQLQGLSTSIWRTSTGTQNMANNDFTASANAMFGMTWKTKFMDVRAQDATGQHRTFCVEHFGEHTYPIIVVEIKRQDLRGESVLSQCAGKRTYTMQLKKTYQQTTQAN